MQRPCVKTITNILLWHPLDATIRLRKAFCKTRGIEATCVGCEKRLVNRNAFDAGYYCY